MRHKRLVVSGPLFGTPICGDSLLQLLIARSKWFEVTPLPDDEWEIRVKNEPGLPSPERWEECQ